MKNGIALLLIGLMQIFLQAQSLDLETSLAQAITNKVYQNPTATELTEAKRLFQRTLLAQRPDAELASDWAALGFKLQEIPTSNESLWLLCPPAGDDGGRGWYLFRNTPHSSIALEAPHAQNDVHTGMIGLRLFLTGQTRALAVSTITRHRTDVAHRTHTFFHAFTLAFAEACPTGLVVQLHGFDARKHPNVHADMIASAGTRSREAWLTDLVQQLRNTTSVPVLAYPKETDSLGGTQNAQASAIRQTRHCRFLHLEMSRELRDRLTHDKELRRTILYCVSSAKP